MPARPSGLSFPFLAPLLALALSACQATGDFGRPNAGFTQGTALPLAGKAVAYTRDEPVSLIEETDEEKELRRRAWHFLMPIEKGWMAEAAGIAKVDRILPAEVLTGDDTAYYRAVRGLPHASTEAFMARLIDDMSVDAELLSPFWVVGDQVEATDRQRLASIDIFGPSEREASYIKARVAENRLLMDQVKRGVIERHAAYIYAAKRFSVEAPSPRIGEVRLALLKLEDAAGLIGPNMAPGAPNIVRAGAEAEE
ncbi:MAG: hypothetical protein U1E56_00570 [Bauldia sp.]